LEESGQSHRGTHIFSINFAWRQGATQAKAILPDAAKFLGVFQRALGLSA
jgi:hypothetical protein